MARGGTSAAGHGSGAPSAAGASLVGQTLGSFRVTGMVGEGGMGQVYLAEHVLIGRKAAIKVLSAEIAGHEEVVSRFFTEARAVNDIRHPNIVEVTDFGSFGNQPYIVMEYLEGETLEQRLERVTALDDPTAARIAAQVASAVGAAHEHGMVHRDLKPANIFLRNHPDYPDFVKVLDFGIAKLMGGDGRAAAIKHRTESGSVIGTPAYMSPEQCLGDLSLDHRSDIYSLGVVLYLMVTGRLPFSGDTVGRLIMSHIQEAPVPPAAVNRAVSAAMSAVILRALEKKPERRFGSMRELREALRYVGDHALTPPPVSVPPVAGPTRTALATAPTTAAPAGPSPETLRQRLFEIVRGRVTSDELELPALPPRVLRVLDVTASAGFSFASVAAILREDPRLPAQVFQIALSAPGRGGPANLEQAVARLGAQGVRAAVIEASARPVLEPRVARMDEAFRKPWQHAIAVATLTQRLAEAVLVAVDPTDAYLAGLLHDAGKPIVAQLLFDIERQMATIRGRRWLSESLWEACLLETHAVVGARLARAWGLPEPIAAAIAAAGNGADLSLAKAIRLADALAAQEGFWSRKEDVARAPAAVQAARAALSVDDRVLARVVGGIKDRVARRA